jgi:hypothetical protein
MADCLIIARGSTKSFTLNLPEGYDISTAKEVWVTFEQDRKEILTLSLSKGEITVEDNKINVSLTQDQTLMFRTGDGVMQTRILTEEDDSLVQFPFTTIKVVPILKDGVISNE